MDTSSISAPARSIVAGTQYRLGDCSLTAAASAKETSPINTS
jgi:hypothetical protein